MAEILVYLTDEELLLLRQRLSDGPGTPAVDSVLDAKLWRALWRAQAQEPAKLGRHEDERGVIQDLLGQTDAITEITTRAGAIRGNHVHKLTTQWAYVVSGEMLFARLEDDGLHTAVYGTGALVTEHAEVPHAWKAVTDCTVLVFTKGPRSGEAYEIDTQRLENPILE